VTDTNSSTAHRTANAFTGAFTTTSAGTSHSEVAETGNRGEAYTLDSVTDGTSAGDRSGNSITGAYTGTTSDTTDGTTVRVVQSGTDGSFHLTETTHEESSGTRDGNSVTGDYTA